MVKSLKSRFSGKEEAKIVLEQKRRDAAQAAFLFSLEKRIRNVPRFNILRSYLST